MENDDIIKCPKCGSDRVKKVENEDDFLHVKPEGEPARKQKNDINQNIYYCLDCGYKWNRKMQDQNSQQEIFCADCGSRKNSRYCDKCKKETPNLFKINQIENIKIKATLGGRIKRGEKSWTFIYYVFGVLLAISTFIISTLDIQGIYKLFLFIIGIIFLIWLCFFNGWFQNKIIGIKGKIEETWRKL